MTEHKKDKNIEKLSSTFTINDFTSKTNLTPVGKYGDYYDVAENRQNGASTKSSFAHLMKSSLGSGILAMPLAFSNAGLAFGSIATIVVGILCTHCVHILVQCSQSLCRDLRTPRLNYAETAEGAFERGPVALRKYAKSAGLGIDIGMMCTYYGASAVYIVFIATSFHDVINYDLGIDWDKRIYILFTLIPCMMFGQVRNLKYLVPFSTMANIFIIVVFGITLFYIFDEPLVFSDKALVAPITKIPLFFATVVFALEGIGAVMPVENSMARPQRFLGCPGILNMAMTVVVLFYGIIGFLGYARFGSKVKGSITLNLPEGAVAADIAKILMGMSILFTYGLQFYIPNELFFSRIKHKFDESKHVLYEHIMRSSFVLITGAVTLIIPELEPFISLIGAIFFSFVGFLAPVIIQTAYLWPNMGWCKWILVKNILIAIFAILAMISGTVVSVTQIIDLYS